MRVISVNISLKVGEIKNPVPKGRFLTDYGMEGDAHGGSGRQVSLLARESYEKSEKTASFPGGLTQKILRQKASFSTSFL